MEEYKIKYQKWCTDDFFDEQTRNELKSIEEESEIKDRFYKDLMFGTGGLRGIMGAGTNRMNIYTVLKATQGLANYLKQSLRHKKGVAIAYDSRNMSEIFSEAAAFCLCANGIPVYRFESLRPTPELSYTVRKLGCIAGIVITASHNPPQYNGYKVYWEDGAQITHPIDKELITAVNQVKDYSEIKTMTKEEAKVSGLYHVIGKEIDDSYIKEIVKLCKNREILKEHAKDIKIVYTPLHGSGNMLVKRILAELNFSNITIVPEQEAPDGDFPTVKSPNPEDKNAFTLALRVAEREGADLVLATDPDADRIGVYVKDNKTGKYISFDGNMTGQLIAEYELSAMKRKQILPRQGVLLKTIVSSDMAFAIGENYGVSVSEVLTGFKYIGEQIKLFEAKKDREFIFGFEESYGCLLGTYTRDKDAIVAVMALCEAAVYYKQQNMSLWDKMLEMYEHYGYYLENAISIIHYGEVGAEKIQKIMADLRLNPLKEIANFKVLAVRDYKEGVRKELLTGVTAHMELPKSNVLYYELENNAWFCIRPSGTEPKIKCYFGVKGKSLEEANDKGRAMLNALKLRFQ